MVRPCISCIWAALTDTCRSLTRDLNGAVVSGHSFRYMKVFMLIIESAMIYSAAVLIEIVLYFSNSNAFYIVYDPIAQLTVSVPSLLAVIQLVG